MAGIGNMKVKIDLSDMVRLVQVQCWALKCLHNTVNRSHGESAGLCDYKHICINDLGACRAYTHKGKNGNGKAAQ